MNSSEKRNYFRYPNRNYSSENGRVVTIAVNPFVAPFHVRITSTHNMCVCLPV